MKGMQKIQRGSGFRGCAEYLFDHDGGRVIGGNMCGSTPRALAAEFGVARRLRPDIEKPVWHNSLRLPADERAKVGPQEWRQIGDDYMHGMGFSDQHQWVYVLHNGHMHILANRVALDGKVYLGRNENLRSTGLIQSLERAYGLTVTKGPKRTEKGCIATPDQRKTRVGERRRYERLEEKPPRERLQQLVAEAAKGRPTVAEFVARLKTQGVSVWPKFTVERLDGFSFGLAGVAFTGQQLGDKFRWGRLKKAGVNYDEARDLDALLAAQRANPAVIAELAEAVAQVEVEASVPEIEVAQEAAEQEITVKSETERPALAEGLDLTTEELELARLLEGESRAFEEVQKQLAQGTEADELEAGKQEKWLKMRR